MHDTVLLTPEELKAPHKTNRILSRSSFVPGAWRSTTSEWAPCGIQVNAIAPGFVATDMTPGMKDNLEFARQIPARRVGVPQDIAGSAVFLASHAADYICGQYHCGGWRRDLYLK